MATTPPAEDPKPPRKGPPLVLLGALGALVAGGAIAWVLVAGDRASPPPPAAEGGLVIDSSAEDGKIDPGKPLRCFVQGQFVGELSLTDCARRNGVATDALDVGLDETGALAAAQQAGAQLIPLPPAEEGQPPATEDSALPPADAEAAEPDAASPGTCLRHGGGRWRRVADGVDLNACVQTLFAGRCERPGGATYGRFGQQTLRLVAGKVEISDDNRSFRTLAPQAPDCSLPPVG
ncbi:MAG: hypothetical protein EPO51_03945 [Phenylobacterium sp.]|uniref:hypothetical protein n=1 Tax=Phenylobacterium sp. TaxID=1871053 RepID=UPI0011FFEC7C|nr:hypothetical protein [Phenylobacterium sp.]TAJ73990.1 MAG: hypothetical protein EPO51_03945 [Phenylobacterium sp.]